MKTNHSITLSPSPEEAMAKSNTYRLLARLWLREVDTQLLCVLQSPPLCEAFVEAGGILPVDGDQDRTIENLAIDYCRLFVGPTDHLPPYQSVWQAGRFQETTVTSMERFLEIIDYDTNILPRGMMRDHFGIQLDMMGQLLSKFSTCQSETENSKIISELASLFFTKHLQWTTQLLEMALQRASTEFYRSMIDLTRSFLDSERQT